MTETTEAETTIDHDAFEAEQRAGITAWVAEHLGGEVTGIERLARWRPLAPHDGLAKVDHQAHVRTQVAAERPPLQQTDRQQHHGAGTHQHQ